MACEEARDPRIVAKDSKNLLTKGLVTVECTGSSRVFIQDNCQLRPCELAKEAVKPGISKERSCGKPV